MDVYDRLQKGDLMQAAAIMASFVYQTAMRDEDTVDANLCRSPNRRYPKTEKTTDTSKVTASAE